jgi:outer membrane lipoprotein carrier protein
MRKRTSRIAVSCGLAVGWTTAAAAQAPDPADLLRRAEAAATAVTSLEARFRQRLVVPALERQQEGRGVIYQKKPDLFLMKFEEPAGDLVLADGTYFWMYTPSAHERQALRTPMERSADGPSLDRQFVIGASRRYVPTYVGADTLSGRPAHVLALVPKFDTPVTLVRVWIDEADFLVRRFEIAEANGTRRTVELTDLRVNVPIPDSVFRWTPPPGVRVVDR